jgi:hypothetical protein
MKVTSICGRFAAATALLFLITVPASAQDDENGPQTWGDDAKYATVTFVQFKSGKREEAMEMIAEYFRPATEKAGTSPPMFVVHFQSGKWDAMFVWDLEGGLTDLQWFRSADELKWFAALAELNGGEEAAGEIMKRWSKTIDEAETHIGHYHSGEE